MKKNLFSILILYILGFLIFLNSCNKPEIRRISLKIKGGKESYLIVTNNGTKTANFCIEINGRCAYSLEKMVEFINRQYHGLPTTERVWRFVSNFSQHKKRITKNNWHNNPLLLMNSSGGSQCGFRSASMVNILKYMGENARSWCVQGHVISEVFENGKWQVYDPDLGVVYYNKRGEICNFKELCDNTELITSPEKIISITNICDSIVSAP